MPANISIMVLPSVSETAPPQILLERNGVWVDMTPDDQGSNAVDIQTTKQEMDAYFTKIMEEVERQTAAHPADSVSLRAPFTVYYRRLVTTKVREALAAAAETAVGEDLPELRVHTHPFLEWMPWEMFFDGKEFLGLRFRVTRLPITRQVPDVSGKEVNVRMVYNLLANNFLDAAQQTLWADTFNGILAPGRERKFPLPYPSINDIANARDADILHITCHGGLRDPVNVNEVYWTLDGNSPQPINYEVRTAMFEYVGYETRPLVFGNACASTASGSARRNGLLPGYGSSFFARGALNFVGTFAPITKSLAVEFARLFYRNLLGGPGRDPLPIAQALWATKNYYRNTVKSQDPTYLFYCLYGPSDTVFRV